MKEHIKWLNKKLRQCTPLAPIIPFIKMAINNAEDNLTKKEDIFSDEEIKEMAIKEILYNDIKRAWWIEGAKYINNIKLKK